MTLQQIFAHHAASGVEGDAGLAADAIESSLAQLWTAGRAAWPAIEIDAESFVTFLAKQLPPELATASGLAALHAADLYLVCGLGRGHPVAIEAIEADCMPAVERALRRMKLSDASILDVTQGLYSYLLERQNAPQAAHSPRRGYVGRGELRGWLCTCAVHEAARLQKRERRHLDLDLDQAPDLVLSGVGQSPEQAALTGELKQIFDASFRHAVATLTPRERNLLRYHFLSGLSIDQIGAIYRVHRATAARWVAEARERLASRTRKHFLASTPMREKSYAEIIGLVRSQLALNLANLLQEVTAGDQAAPKNTTE